MAVEKAKDSPRERVPTSCENAIYVFTTVIPMYPCLLYYPSRHPLKTIRMENMSGFVYL